jgi:4-amino-4-deoxy-L-arabinose transferase-like glycosyltransferase
MHDSEVRPAATADTTSVIRGQVPREVWLLAALGLGVCLVVRLIYFTQYAHALPFLWGPVGDSIIYLEQASHVLRGEHGDATLLAFSPVYGYALAALGSPLDPVTVAVLQLLSGVLIAAIVFATVYRRMDGRAAVISTLLFGLYGGVLFFESKILSDSLGLLLAATVQALFLLPQFRKANPVVCVVSGVLLALAVLTRASLVFSAPLFVLAALLPFSSSPQTLRLRAQRSLWMAAGIALILVGHGLWTKHYAGVFVPVILPSQTLEASESATWTGDVHQLSGGAHLAHPHAVVLSARDYLAKRRTDPDTARPRARINVLAWIRGLPHKLPGTFSNTERTFQYGYLGERSAVPLLGALPISFGVLLILGLVGAWACVRDKRAWALVPLLPLFLGAIACTTLYHPSTRYRLAMIIPLLLLAGPGLTWLWRTRRERSRGLFLGVIVVSCVIAAGHNLSKTMGNPALWELELAMSNYNAGNDEASLEHLSAAEAAAPHNRVVQARVDAGRQLLAARAKPPPR